MGEHFFDPDRITRHHIDQLIEVLKERNELAKETNRLMSTFSDTVDSAVTALGSLVTDDQGLRTQITTLESENADLTAQLAAVDPNAQQEIADATTKLADAVAVANELLNPTPPPAPDAISVLDQTVGPVPAGQPLNGVQIVASGGNGGQLSFSQSGLDQALSLDALGVLTGTPSASSTFQVTVTDGTVTSDPATITVSVS